MGTDGTKMTPTGMGDNTSLTEYVPDAGSVCDSGAINDDHREKHFSGARYLIKNPCGNSAVEARARGCLYGVVNSACLPEECYDEELRKDSSKSRIGSSGASPTRRDL